MSRPVEGQISRNGKSIYRRGVWRQILHPPTREEIQALMDAPLRNAVAAARWNDWPDRDENGRVRIPRRPR
jgi:hypothetical protein